MYVVFLDGRADLSFVGYINNLLFNILLPELQVKYIIIIATYDL